MSAPGLTLPADVFDPQRLLLALKGSTQHIPLIKKTIARVSDYFHQQYQQGCPIRELVYGRAQFVDQLLACVWQTFDWPGNDISLVAVGGYGRGELHPHSDIDLLILIGDNCLDQYQQPISEFVTLLWDMNLQIGHSVRTIDECLREAAKDITVATNLLEWRLIAGDAHKMQDLVARNQSWTSEAFFRAKWDEQIARHRKHGNSEYNLEPNIKSSPGALRDIQMIGWIAKKHFGIGSLEELVKLGFLTPRELSILNEGTEYLWRVRYALHMLSGREEDRLLFDHQRTLAKLFGFEDDDARLAVERFMQQYYRWALKLGQLNDLLMQHFDETILRACEAEEVMTINARFRLRNGHIEVANDKVFERYPSALMEIFVLMAQNDHIDGVRASTIRLIREHRNLIDDQFRKDPRNCRFFMDVLRSPQKVALQLRRMLRFGVLGRYLPEFGRIIGQMQHDLFHIYSVDAHTMEVVKNIRRFTYNTYQSKYPIAARVVKRLPKIELLLIAGLYHDIAKGRGGDHSKLGVEDVRAFAARHELNSQDTNLVAWLVEHHLLMSAVAQRQDISDPDVIHDFAIKVGDQMHLDYLYTLTVADINATNPNLWNSWRASLLRQLYGETKRALRRGLEQTVDKHERIESAQLDAIDHLEDLGFAEEEIRHIWNNTSDEYFLREKHDDIVWHTEAIAQHSRRDKPLILIRENGEMSTEGATQIFVYTQAQRPLFALLASSLELLDLNIQDARYYHSGHGMTMLTFYVLDSNGHSIGDDPARIAHIRDFLIEQIAHPERYSEILQRRTPRTMRLFSVPTETAMSTDASGAHSILEVITADRPGLLARIARIFLEYNIQLQNAKIATLGERVEDIFFITDIAQQPIKDPYLCEEIQSAIRKELDDQAAA